MVFFSSYLLVKQVQSLAKLASKFPYLDLKLRLARHFQSDRPLYSTECKNDAFHLLPTEPKSLLEPLQSFEKEKWFLAHGHFDPFLSMFFGFFSGLAVKSRQYL